MKLFHEKHDKLQKVKKHKFLKRNIFLWIKLFAFSSLAIILLFTLPFLGQNSDNLSLIFSKFIGNKSEYQGIIEIWNIDTFESGTASKTSYLKSISENYQKQNKGIYFMIRNMTEQECLTLLESGECPDLFSCSYGVSNKLLDYIDCFSNSQSVTIREEFYNAGMINDNLYGLAWCRGSYFLISTEDNLTKAGVDITQKYSLLDLALSVGYKIENKNSTKTIYSLSFGTGKYLLPQLALSSYNNNGVSSNDLSFNTLTLGQSSYVAYTKFVAGESVMLLGTQRDVFRMENKVSGGKVSGVVYEALTEFTDLLQFFFIAKSDDELKQQYAEDFALFVTSEKSQSALANIGLFPVIEAKVDDYNSGVMSDIISQINGTCKVFNVFLTDNELDELRDKQLSELSSSA